MAGYTRTDTTNNIADGNIISATDLDNEFDGVQAAFNSSTGHNHDGTTGEGAPILVLGPTQDVVVGAAAVTPKTTNTVDIGSGSLKFKDLFLAGNANFAGTTTLGGALTYGGVTLSNAVTGTGNMVLSASPTLTGTISGANASLSGTLAVTGVATLGAGAVLNTPASVTLTNATGLPISTGISGLGTGIATALAVNVGTAGAPVINGGALGTPSSGTVTNLTGTASININGTVGATTANTGAFTDLTTSGSVTHNGGTASGVAYLNGSKVLTTGSELTFDGTNIQIGKDVSGAVTNSISLGNSGIGGGIVTSTLFLARYGDNYGAYIQAIENYGAAITPPLIFGVADAEQMRLTSTGLGIGTSSPSNKLTVNSGASTTIAQFTSTGSSAFLGLANSGATTFIGNDSTSGNFIIQTPSGGFSTKLTLDNSGNLGIGTSSPGAKLELSQFSTTTPSLRLRYSSTSVYADHLMDGNGNYVIQSPAANGVTSGGIVVRAGAEIQFFTNNNTGGDQMRLDSSGNLGLGVTPSAWGSGSSAIQNSAGGIWRFGTDNIYFGQNYYFNGTNRIYSTSNNATEYQQGNGIHRWFTAPSGTAGDAISFTQSMTLNASGNLGIGTSSPTQKLTVQAAAGYLATFQTSDANKPRFQVYVDDTDGVSLVSGYDTAAKAMVFYTGGSARLRLDSSGNLLVGTTSTSGKLTVSTADAAQVAASITASNSGFYNQVLQINCARGATTGYNLIQANNSSSTECFKVTGAGDVQNTNNSYGAISDAKLKENVTDATPKLDKLNQVRVVNFNMIGSEQKQIGVIAQELEQIFPGMVDESPDRDAEGNDLGTTTKSVKYSVFVPMLIKALQEATTEINSLKARLDAANL